jgi:ABC-2 type transport system permease protein
MKVWHSILLVMGREFRARKKAFSVVSTVLVTLAVGGIVIAYFAASNEGGPRMSSSEADQLLGSLSVIFLFLAIIFTGQVIMEGVAEEKRSRVVEVVLGTMHPRHLLIGKVTAIGLLGFAEIVLALGSLLATAEILDVFEIPRGTAVGLATVVIWFLLGFSLYSVFYGASGALVAPHENVANAAFPINMILVIPYMVTLTSVRAGDTMALRVLSLVPLTAPLSMPTRMVRGFAAPWEIAVSMALVVVTTYGLTRFAGRLYAGAVMQGGKVRWAQAWRTARDLR